MGNLLPTMNGERYRNYLIVLEALDSGVFSSDERELLADAAEGLLLARGPRSDETDELEAQVVAILDELVAGARLRRANALELRARIVACGPARRRRSARVARA